MCFKLRFREISALAKSSHGDDIIFANFTKKTPKILICQEVCFTVCFKSAAGRRNGVWTLKVQWHFLQRLGKGVIRILSSCEKYARILTCSISAFTCPWWQVTLGDPIRQVTLRGSEMWFA